MMQVIDIQWSETEQHVAKAAFDKAYAREVKTMIEQVRSIVGDLNEIDDIWKLHDLLSIQRHTLDGKYDSRDSALLFVFAQLIQEGWLSREELDGLSPEKLKKISALTRM